MYLYTRFEHYECNFGDENTIHGSQLTGQDDIFHDCR